MKNVSIWYLCFIIAFCIFVGCNAQKQIQRKDNAAVERVNSKSSLQTPVVNEWLKAHPQDTTPRIIVSEPKVITIYQNKLIRDTTGRKRLIDSVLKASQDTVGCAEAAQDAYDLGYEEAEKKYLSIPFKVNCPPDTTKTYFMTTEINRWKDSASGKSILLGYKNGRIDVLNQQIKEQDKKINKQTLIIIGLIFLAVISHVARSYLPNIKLPKI